jgi:hypothetical protein
VRSRWYSNFYVVLERWELWEGYNCGAVLGASASYWYLDARPGRQPDKYAISDINRLPSHGTYHCAKTLIRQPYCLLSQYLTLSRQFRLNNVAIAYRAYHRSYKATSRKTWTCYSVNIFISTQPALTDFCCWCPGTRAGWGASLRACWHMDSKIWKAMQKGHYEATPSFDLSKEFKYKTTKLEFQDIKAVKVAFLASKRCFSNHM